MEIPPTFRETRMNLTHFITQALRILTAASLAVFFFNIPGHSADDAPGEKLSVLMSAHAPTDPGAGLTAKFKKKVNVDGVMRPVGEDVKIYPGMHVPDGRGGYVWIKDKDPMIAPPEDVERVREFKLKIRELSDRLLMPTGQAAELQALEQDTVISVSFVDMDKFDRSSSFGRFLGESMIHEFSRRGLPVREFRNMGLPEAKPGMGEFAMTRDGARLLSQAGDGLIIGGTYYHDADTVFINARLFRAADGMVLRTAAMELRQSDMLRTMLAKGTTNIRPQAAQVGFSSYEAAKDPTSIQQLFMEEDLH
jgi:TolB-like protein